MHQFFIIAIFALFYRSYTHAMEHIIEKPLKIEEIEDLCSSYEKANSHLRKGMKKQHIQNLLSAPCRDVGESYALYKYAPACTDIIDQTTKTHIERHRDFALSKNHIFTLYLAATRAFQAQKRDDAVRHAIRATSLICLKENYDRHFLLLRNLSELIKKSAEQGNTLAQWYLQQPDGDPSVAVAAFPLDNPTNAHLLASLPWFNITAYEARHENDHHIDEYEDLIIVEDEQKQKIRRAIYEQFNNAFLAPETLSTLVAEDIEKCGPFPYLQALAYIHQQQYSEVWASLKGIHCGVAGFANYLERYFPLTYLKTVIEEMGALKYNLKTEKDIKEKTDTFLKHLRFIVLSKEPDFESILAACDTIYSQKPKNKNKQNKNKKKKQGTHTSSSLDVSTRHELFTHLSLFFNSPNIKMCPESLFSRALHMLDAVASSGHPEAKIMLCKLRTEQLFSRANAKISQDEGIKFGKFIEQLNLGELLATSPSFLTEVELILKTISEIIHNRSPHNIKNKGLLQAGIGGHLACCIGDDHTHIEKAWLYLKQYGELYNEQSKNMSPSIKTAQLSILSSYYQAVLEAVSKIKNGSDIFDQLIEMGSTLFSENGHVALLLGKLLYTHNKQLNTALLMFARAQAQNTIDAQGSEILGMLQFQHLSLERDENQLKLDTIIKNFQAAIEKKQKLSSFGLYALARLYQFKAETSSNTSSHSLNYSYEKKAKELLSKSSYPLACFNTENDLQSVTMLQKLRQGVKKIDLLLPIEQEHLISKIDAYHTRCFSQLLLERERTRNLAWGELFESIHDFQHRTNSLHADSSFDKASAHLTKALNSTNGVIVAQALCQLITLYQRIGLDPNTIRHALCKITNCSVANGDIQQKIHLSTLISELINGIESPENEQLCKRLEDIHTLLISPSIIPHPLTDASAS